MVMNDDKTSGIHSRTLYKFVLVYYLQSMNYRLLIFVVFIGTVQYVRQVCFV